MPEIKAAIDPKHAILLVMDYQPGILSNLPGANELLARMADTIKLLRGRGVQIGYVRVAFTDTDHETIPEHNSRFKELATNGKMHHESPQTAIHAEVAPEPGDIVVRKTRVGPFTTTDLDRQLHDRQIDTLILAGVSTSGVVLSTVREAADRDYQVFVLEDGSADSDQAVHDMLIQRVFPRQARVISVADLPQLLESR
ncbi:MAG: sle [Candidatus Saccharibacteria bacterium]|nr:sle [Candidatus Saccharibacteria bacterium]